ncbi:hypothetical protein EIP86_008384 [Pleurotus ostreatoroseus]|nr:hypothetical protein EIP86_008384 [Pleurotus ostreatoroseus]
MSRELPARETLRSPAPLSPRTRPGGPRTRRPHHALKPSTSTAPSEHEDESLPGYSGTNSPAISSLALSSPATPAFEPAHDGGLHLHSLSVPDFRGHREQAVQTEAATPTSARSLTPAVKVILKSPTLTPPAPVSFESVPIAWRGMTLESAKWNMTSEQLQDIVSRAIRKTAQESFIRLLPVKTLDEELGAELERLETLKATTQSQYRFNLHRRTMLLQSLLALASNEDCDCAVLCNLTTQLADITSTCDRLMMDLLRVTDQKAQIHRIQDVHVSSALAMALRKLNASYAKRTTELKEARDRADQLKAELEEAWAVAQEMAEEMDELENFHSGFSSEEDDGDEDRRMDDSIRLAEVIGITGRAVATKATLTQLEAARNREREYQSGRSSRVSAARKRSSLASKASLRLPKSSKSSVADVTSLSSRLSTRRSLHRRPSEAASSSSQSIPPVVPVDPRIQAAPRDDSFLDLSLSKRQSIYPPGTSNPAAGLSSVPINGQHPAQSSSSRTHIQQPSLDFAIPPIAVHHADDDEPLPNPHSADDDGSRPLPSPSATRRRRMPSRRVHSLQPMQGSLDLGLAETQEDGLKRTSSDRRRVDAWPWGGESAGGQMSIRQARRQSMPLSPAIRESHEEAEPGSGGGRRSDPGHADPVPFPTVPLSRSPSRALPKPPPKPTTVPSSSSSPVSLQTGSSSSRVFSFPTSSSSIASTAPP